MTVEVWIYLGLAFVAVFAVGVFFGCLSGRYDTRHGGTLDLTMAAAKGELDLDWNDSRAQRRLEVVASYDVPGEGRYEVINGGPARLVEPERRPSFGV